MTPSDPLKSRVLVAVRAIPSPIRARRAPSAGWTWVLVVGAMLAVLLLAGGPGHGVGRPPAVGGWILAGAATLAVLVTGVLLPGRRSMLPPPTAWLVLVALGVPFLVGAWLLAWHAAYADPFTRTGLRCFVLTLAAAPWPFAAMVLAGPRAIPERGWLLGGALGAASGAWAAIVVELWCPLAEPSHVAIGHVAPLLVLVVAGAALGSRVLRVRR